MMAAVPGRQSACLIDEKIYTDDDAGDYRGLPSKLPGSNYFKNIPDIDDNGFFLISLHKLYALQFETRTKSELTLDLLERWERWLHKDARRNWVKIKQRAIPVRFCLELFEPKQIGGATGVEKVFQQTNGVIGLIFEVLRRTANGTRNYKYDQDADRNWLLYWLRLQSLDILDQSTSSRRSGSDVPRFVPIDGIGKTSGSDAIGSATSNNDFGNPANWYHQPQLSDRRDPLEILQVRETLDRFVKDVFKEEARILADVDAIASTVLSWCARQVMTGKSRQEILLSRQWADDAAVRRATNAILDQACTRFRERVRILDLGNLAIAIRLAQENPRSKRGIASVPPNCST